MSQKGFLGTICIGELILHVMIVTGIEIKQSDEMLKIVIVPIRLKLPPMPRMMIKAVHVIACRDRRAKIWSPHNARVSPSSRNNRQ